MGGDPSFKTVKAPRQMWRFFSLEIGPFLFFNSRLYVYTLANQGSAELRRLAERGRFL